MLSLILTITAVCIGEQYRYSLIAALVWFDKPSSLLRPLPHAMLNARWPEFVDATQCLVIDAPIAFIAILAEGLPSDRNGIRQPGSLAKSLII